jgi:D-alanine-D-alanine ligase
MRRVGLIFGSRSVEHEISVTTASKVYEALRQLAGEYETVLLYLNRAGAWLTGQAVAPGLFDVMVVLGRGRVVAQLWAG